MDTKDATIVQLFVEMDVVFSIIRQEEDYPISEIEEIEIQNALSAGSYRISPMKLVFFEKGDPLQDKFLVAVELPGEPNYLISVYVEPSDELVFYALGGLLNQVFLSHNVFHPASFAYQKDNQIQDFFSKVVGWGKVELLFYFDLFPSKYTISRSRLLEKLEPLIKDHGILKLVESYLEWPILDREGNLVSIKRGFPPAVSFLSGVLFNFYLDLLDRHFEECFPAFPYARWDNEVLIPIFPGKSENFDVHIIRNLLMELDLVGKVICIVPGGTAVSMLRGVVFINDDGQIQIMGSD